MVSIIGYSDKEQEDPSYPVWRKKNPTGLQKLRLTWIIHPEASKKGMLRTYVKALGCSEHTLVVEIR